MIAESRRADELFEQSQRDIHRRTDRLFAGLMAFQWLAGIVFALWVSPLAWFGPFSRTHVHVWAAVIVGGIICLPPALLALMRPGRASTRYTVAVAQMLMGALLIHLTGGRIETHFHVFGSLAFLAFYRDWRVLVPATIVVALDHMLRGFFWPESVYGVLTASQWAGSSMRPGCSSRTCSSSSRAAAASRRCGRQPSARPRSSSKSGRGARLRMPPRSRRPSALR